MYFNISVIKVSEKRFKSNEGILIRIKRNQIFRFKKKIKKIHLLSEKGKIKLFQLSLVLLCSCCWFK